MDQPDRYGVEEVQLLSAAPAADDEPRLFQEAQVLHHAEARHVHLGFELGQCPAVALEEEVQQVPTCLVGERLEHAVVVHCSGGYVTKWSPVKGVGVPGP